MAFFDGAMLIFGGRISTACSSPDEQNASTWCENGTLQEHDATCGRGSPSPLQMLSARLLTELGDAWQVIVGIAKDLAE